MFRNVPRHNGAEAYRRITEPILASKADRRADFQDKVNNPRRAKNIPDLPRALEEWDSNYRMFIENGGKDLDNEEKRNLLLKMIPTEAAAQLTMQIANVQDYSLLKKAIKDFVRTVAKIQGTRAGPLHVVDGQNEGDSQDFEGSQDMPELSEEERFDMLRERVGEEAAVECFAFMRGGGGNRGGGGRPPFRPRNGAPAKGTKFAAAYGGQFGGRGAALAPPRGREDMNCVNCWKKGPHCGRLPGSEG